MIFHLVSHTHWDREWYQPAVRFRQRLVAMIDELIDDPPTGGASFLLDGQTVVIDDYLAVRPERAEALNALLRSGALEAGPWFVQADELIPGAEAFIRNLLQGKRTLDALGVTPPPVLYCPDTFGHPAALPTLARGFGCTSIVASRGYGSARWPSGDSAWWIAPDGDRVLFYHLSKTGYETAAQLPPDKSAAATRWIAIRDDLGPRSKLGAVLLMNGADHHARQARLREAMAVLAEAALPDEIIASSLTAFGKDIAARGALGTLPEIRGELRDSYGSMWTLQGTFGTRAHQKRRNAQLERVLTRDVEPWAVLATASSGIPRKALIDAAWRSLILCHPHDTICGCSIDEVGRAMDARLEETASQASGIRGDALFDIIGHDAERARVAKESWKPAAIVRNAAARPRSGVARVRLTSFLADVKVGLHPDAAPSPTLKAVTPSLADGATVQVLARTVEDELTESPRHYPDDDLVAVADTAVWIPEVPAYGTRAFRHVKRARPAPIPNPAHANGTTISNGRITLVVDEHGGVQLADHIHGRIVENLVSWESRVDLGDEYTPSPRGTKFDAQFGGARVTARGPVRAAIATKWTFRIGKERVDARIEFIIDADARALRIELTGTNAASDHRLRLRIASDVKAPRVFADAMFGPVERVPLAVSEADARMEYPLPTAPLHRYVSLFGTTRGATVYSDGLCEYETDAAGATFITVVRAVGELSRGDLPERPGNAGWPTPTPGAQCHGPFGAEIGVFLHGARSSATIDDIERTADDVLLPLAGATLRSAIDINASTTGVELTGTGLAFAAAKPGERDGWIALRCVNLTDETQMGRWRIAAPISEARRARLDETPGDTLQCREGAVEFRAKPREVVTILVR